VSPSGAEPVARRPRIALLWHRHRARWTLPLVIIVIIGLVAIVDHVASQRISQVDEQNTSALVAASGGSVVVNLDQPWAGFNPNTPAGANSSTTTLLASVLPSAYVVDPKLTPEVNTDLLSSVEATSTSPLTIQYMINPQAVWSDGVHVDADDFIYQWQSQRGDGLDVNGQPDQVASTLGYRDVASVTGSDPPHGSTCDPGSITDDDVGLCPNGLTVTVVFTTPYTDWRVMFDHMVPGHVARRVGWSHGFDSFNPSNDLSAGPMIVQSVATDGRAVLVRNPKWWGTPAILGRVTVRVAPTQASWAGSLARVNQAVAQPTSFDLQSLNVVSSLPNTQSGVHPSLNMYELDFDVTSPVTVHPAARQAIAHAINRSDLLAQTFGVLDSSLVVNQDHLGVAAQPDYQASSAAGEYDFRDLVTTDRLLRSLGYHQDATGTYVDASGAALTIRMAVEMGNPWIAQVATEIVAQLHEAGLTVVTVPVDGTAGLTAAAADNSYEIALVSRLSSPYESASADWYSEDQGALGVDDQQNWSNFDDPQVDQLFSQAEEALNPVTGESIYGQIDDQLWDQMISLPLFGEPAFQANGVQIGNVQFNASPDGLLWNLPQWSTLKPGSSGPSS
jgi:peptide/nickel transport system substrate-binding protein